MTLCWRESRRVRGHCAQGVLAGEPVVVVDDGREHESHRAPAGPAASWGRGLPTDRDGGREGRAPSAHRRGNGEPPHLVRRPYFVDTSVRRVGHRRGGFRPGPTPTGRRCSGPGRGPVPSRERNRSFGPGEPPAGSRHRVSSKAPDATRADHDLARGGGTTSSRSARPHDGARWPSGGPRRLRRWFPRTGRRCSSLHAWCSASRRELGRDRCEVRIRRHAGDGGPVDARPLRRSIPAPGALRRGLETVPLPGSGPTCVSALRTDPSSAERKARGKTADLLFQKRAWRPGPQVVECGPRHVHGNGISERPVERRRRPHSDDRINLVVEPDRHQRARRRQPSLS